MVDKTKRELPTPFMAKTSLASHVFRSQESGVANALSGGNFSCIARLQELPTPITANNAFYGETSHASRASSGRLELVTG